MLLYEENPSLNNLSDCRLSIILLNLKITEWIMEYGLSEFGTVGTLGLSGLWESGYTENVVVKSQFVLLLHV